MEITITKVQTKDGTGKRGAWALTKWTDENDIVWSTFDKAARSPQVGATVEIPEWETNEYGRDFQKWTLVAAATPETAAAATATTNGRDDATRISIERQSSAATLLNYAANTNETKLSDDMVRAIQKAIGWLSSRFDDNGTTDIPRTAPIGKPVEDLFPPKDDAEFANVGELLKWCYDKGVDRDKFMELMEVQDSGMSKVNVEAAHQKVREYLATL